MKNRPLLIIALGGAIVLGGCSGLPAPKPTATVAPSTCAQGSNRLGPQSCPPFTQRYSARQLRQTGHTNAARALAALDPAVTSQGP